MTKTILLGTIIAITLLSVSFTTGTALAAHNPNHNPPGVVVRRAKTVVRYRELL
jgi:hypothetical protein